MSMVYSNAIARIAEQAVTERIKGKRNVRINGTPFELYERGYCSEFARECHQAALGAPVHAFGSNYKRYGNPHLFGCCAHRTEQLLREAGMATSRPTPGDIVCFNRIPTGYICSSCGRRVGHIGVLLDQGRFAENTSSGSRGTPREAGTKITPVALLHSRISGYYRLLPVAAEVPYGYADGPVKIVIIDGPVLAGLLQDGTTYAPARELAEAFGGKAYDRIVEQRKVYLEKPG